MAETELSSLEKGLAILRRLASSDTELTPGEVAQAAGLNRTTTYRLCDILERGGWIYRDGTGGRTRIDLGPAAQGLALLISNKYDTEARLRPIIESLAQSVNETVHVGILDNADVIHVARAVPGPGLNMAMDVGARQPAHVTALGKALMSTLSTPELLSLYPDEQLPTRTPKAIGTRRQLLDDLAAAAERGYAIDDEESRSGVRCVASPVFDASMTAVLSISVTAVPARLESERLEVVADAVMAAARLATTSLGGGSSGKPAV